MIILLFAFDLLSALFRGWMLSCVWQWFAVSALRVPPIGAMTGAGIYLMISMMFVVTTKPRDGDIDKQIRNAVESSIRSTIVAFLCFLLAGCIHFLQVNL